MMANNICGLIYFIVAVILGFYIGFREEIKDFIKEVLHIRLDSTPEKDKFEAQVWWDYELSEEEREEALKVIQDPLGIEADLNTSGEENGQTHDPD